MASTLDRGPHPDPYPATTVRSPSTRPIPSRKPAAVQRQENVEDSRSGVTDADAPVGGAPTLDAANRAIIEALQRDGRRPYGSIAEEVGLSEAAVRRRVQRLRESGIMQIVAVTDPLQLGFTRQALVGIRVEGDIRRVADKVVDLSEVDYVVMCAGSFDLLAEVVCENDDRLLQLVNDAIRAIPGVRSTETFLYLKLAKQTYTWGTR
jgi:Lrp/AsnC family transcriptional regulator for asnA, asnC and gidA